MENPPQEERMIILIIAAAAVAVLAVMEHRQADEKIARRAEIRRQARQSIRLELMPPPKRAARWAK
jgi:hypothetical protein